MSGKTKNINKSDDKAADKKAQTHLGPSIIFQYFKFIIQKPQLIAFAIWSVLFTTGFFVFLYCYPNPLTFYESRGYVDAAIANAWDFYRPFGYSKFLILIHDYSNSPVAVYIAQFIIFMFSSLFFISSIKFLYQPKRKVLFYTLMGILFFNPGIFFLSNSIMSDSLFSSLSLIWFTSTLFLLYRFNWFVAIINIIIIYFIVNLRFAGIVYPFLALATLFYKEKINIKSLAYAVFALLITYSTYNTNVTKHYKTFGIKIFAAFSGWQIANNAMHMIPYVDLDSNSINEEDLRTVHRFVKAYPDSSYIKTINDNGITALFMWDNNLPLKKCMFYVGNNKYNTYKRAWVNMGPVYNRYGQMLIKRFPMAYLQHYYLPNAYSIINCDPLFFRHHPAIEFNPVWFNSPEGKLQPPKYDFFENGLASQFRAINLTHWLLLLIGIILLAVNFKKVEIQLKYYKTTLIFFIIFIGFNFLFLSYASPIEMRFLYIFYPPIFLIFYIAVSVGFDKPSDK